MNVEWQTLFFGFALTGLFSTQQASAVYNPQTGRWLSRDPIDEPGFQLMQRANALRPAGGRADLPAGRLFRRDPINEHGIGMASRSPVARREHSNDSINAVDFLGLKMEIPSGPKELCADPCGWAKRNITDPDTYGITVCCNGKKYGCVLRPGKATDPTAQEIISSCLQMHENSHVADPRNLCRPRCGWTGPLQTTVESTKAGFGAECDGYSAEVKCLQSKISQCGGNIDCEQQVEEQLKNAQKQADTFCRWK